MAFKTFRLAIAALVLTVFITACQNDRISRSLSPETGEFYSSDALSSTRSGHSEEERKLQADFDAFCTELFRKEMESSSTLDLHYTLLHPENYGIDAEDAALGTYRLSEFIKSNHEIHDLKEKLSEFDPHMLSDDQQILYDALFDMLGAETYQKYLERGNIEVAPLAYMRGRTLDDSFIILDEAQNTTREQMKMFLTRLGFGSKIVITGDITQIDLPGDKVSGLKEAIRVLDGVEDIQICRLTPADVVRHVLVQRIVAAYDKYEKNRLPDERARTFTKKPDWKREKK